jgi:hypothetical protein
VDSDGLVPWDFLLLPDEAFLDRLLREAARKAEEADRRAWIEDVKARLGIRTIEDCSSRRAFRPARPERPVLCVDGPLRGQVEQVSGRTFYRIHSDVPDGALTMEALETCTFTQVEYVVSEIVAFGGMVSVASCEGGPQEEDLIGLLLSPAARECRRPA